MKTLPGDWRTHFALAWPPGAALPGTGHRSRTHVATWRPAIRWLGAAALAGVLSACGGGGSSSTSVASGLPDQPTSLVDATRMADQSTMGNTEAVQAEIMRVGAQKWVDTQFAQKSSRYSLGGNAGADTSGVQDFCAEIVGGSPDCWRDYYSSQPLLWDFYRNALTQPDQLRQRVALALQQMVVISNVEVDGTYGLREYHNMLLDNAFGNYRDLLQKVSLSPIMGDYLDNVNNDKAAPNENYARELLQLFSLGTCELNPDASLKTGKCVPTYNNDVVRAYAFALTGWTYPAGGKSYWGCWPKSANCRYYVGDMAPRAGGHDETQRVLLGGVTVPARSTAPQALQLVLDSLMNHPNVAPFVARQLIQHLTTSNPSGPYVQRVANAFTTGKHGVFGQGAKGDLQATVAAILLDTEARRETPDANFGRLREPAQLFTATLRALGGQTDGEPFAWWWGDTLRQHMFRPPSVFNYYPPDYPLAGTSLRGPQFGILNANTGFARMNYVDWLVYDNQWRADNPSPDPSIPGSMQTLVNLQQFEADAADPVKLVDRMNRLATGGRMSASARQAVIDAVAAWDVKTSRTGYLQERVKTAAYLVFSAPQFNIAR